MSDISKIKPNGAEGNEYDLKDAFAREEIRSTKTTSGNPITITDAAPINAEKLEVVLEPKQDLHGQSYPYVGGAGKNKLPLTVDGIKAANTAGAWNGNIYTFRNIAFTILTDNDGNVTGINVNGTTNNSSAAKLILFEDLSNSCPFIDYELNGCPTGGGSHIYYIRLSDLVTSSVSDYGTGSTTIRVTATGKWRAIIEISPNVQVTNKVFYPMISSDGGAFEKYSNICPISGYDEVEVLDRVVNQWDEEWELGALNTSTGELTSSTTYFRSKNPISVEPQTTYRFKMANVFGYCFYDKDGNFISGSSSGTLSQNITSPANAKILRFFCKGTTYGNNISINYPSTFTDYVSYQSTTASITFGQTVYGGTVDFKTGVVTVDRALLDLGTDATFEYVSALAVDNIFPFRVSNRKYDSAAIAPISDKIKVTKKTSWSIDENEIIYIDQQDSMRIRIPNCTTVAQIETATTGMHLCYELATPTTLKLTPQELKLLQNTNNINTNGTTITLGYQPNNVVGELKGEIEQAANNFTYALLMSDETSCSLAYTDDYTSINVEIPLVQTYTDTQTQQNYTVDYTNCEFAINGVDIICADYQHDWVLGAEWKVIPQIGSAFKQDGKLKVSVYLRNWKLTSSDNTIRYVTLMLDTLAFGKYIDSRTL